MAKKNKGKLSPSAKATKQAHVEKRRAKRTKFVGPPKGQRRRTQ